MLIRLTSISIRLFTDGLLLLLALPTMAIDPSRYVIRMTESNNIVQARSRFELVRQHVQQGKEPLVIEAEQSTLIMFADKGMQPTADPAASGGFGIAFVRELDNQIVVKTAGTYQVWQRAFFPTPGSWNHYERMDDGPTQLVQDSEGKPAKSWVWVKGPRYPLEPGLHHYRFPSPTAYCGGIRLDKLVLTSDLQFTPEGLGPEARGRVVAQEGGFISNRFRLDDIAAWRLVYEVEDQGGSVGVELSHDRGKTWTPYVADGAMRPVNQEKWLTFRFRFKAAPNGGSPCLSDLFLEYQPLKPSP